MEKFILNQSGKEIKVGDIIVRECSSGGVYLCHKFVVDKLLLTYLVSIGAVRVVEVDSKKDTATPSIPMEIDYYVSKVAKRLGWKDEDTRNILTSMDVTYPSVVLSLLLKEIAIELDMKYPDHINNSPKIYSVSLCNGKITEVNKATIKNYKNFAAFRSIEDAKVACRIMRNYLKYIFKGDK